MKGKFFAFLLITLLSASTPAFAQTLVIFKNARSIEVDSVRYENGQCIYTKNGSKRSVPLALIEEIYVLNQGTIYPPQRPEPTETKDTKIRDKALSSPHKKDRIYSPAEIHSMKQHRGTSDSGTADYGVIIGDRISFEIKDYIAMWNNAKGRIKIYLLSFEIEKQEREKALNNPRKFVSETLSTIRRPDKWATYTPAAYIEIHLDKQGDVEPYYTVGVVWLLKRGSTSQFSGPLKENHAFLLRQLELKKGGIISFLCEGSREMGSKPVQWKVNFKGKIDVLI